MSSKILVADDEASLRCLIQTTLEGPELHVVQALCGADVLRLSECQHFDLIILDWMMPGMTGIEVLERLRQQPRTANVPVLMLTARGQMKDQERAMALGASGYMMKPFSPLELLERINGLIGRRNGAEEPSIEAQEAAQMAEEELQ